MSRLHTSCLAAVACLLLAGGCAHRIDNRPLASRDPVGGYYFGARQRTNNSSDLLVVLAFSGGGTRAAAFSYGVLEELRDTSVATAQGARRMLDEVDVISSVSGGSVTAAAYGLYGDRVFELLGPSFLDRNVQRTLVLQLINPLRWPALWSSTWGRSEMAAKYYDSILFHGATFGDMTNGAAPYLVINATDVTSGARFDFTQHSFDLLGSDLRTFPISYAVAASSAVPGALTPITLNNFSTNGPGPSPDWVAHEYDGRSPWMSRRAGQLRGYLDGTNHAFVHLVDGGVSGNLGLQPIIEYLQSLEFSPQRRAQLASAMPRKIVLISVNAYSAPDKDWDSRRSPPNSVSTAAAAASHTLDAGSFETIELLKSELFRWKSQLPEGNGVAVFPIHLAFTDYREQNQRRMLLNLPTSFFLPGTDVDKLREAGRRLLRENPTFQQFLTELRAESPSPSKPAGE